MSLHLVASVLLLGVGALLLVVAGLLFLRGARQRRIAEGFRDRAVETSAEVVGIVAKDVALAGADDTRYFLRVRYTPEGAREALEAETLTQAPYPPPRVGEAVVVAYDPRHPERVDVAATERSGAGAGRTSYVLGWLTLAVALATPAAWLVLVLVVWTA